MKLKACALFVLFNFIGACDTSSPSAQSTEQVNVVEKDLLSAEKAEADAIELARFERRALEAGLWITPQVMYNAMAKPAYEVFGGDDLSVYYYSKPMNHLAQIVTGNNNSPYVHTYHDLSKHSAIVVELPAANDTNALFGTFLDSWHKPIVDVGPDGVDAGKGGKYLLIGPDFNGDIPAGYIVVKQDTYKGYLSTRSLTATTSDEDMARSEAYIKLIKVYPLGADGTATRHIDLLGTLYDATIKYDMSFWQSANEMVQSEIIKSDEKAFYGMLKSIGIEKGKEFKPSPEHTVILKKVSQQLHNEMMHDVANFAPRLWGDKSHWTLPVPRTMMTTDATYVDPNWTDYQGRGATFYFYFAPPASLADSKSTTYIKGAHDIDGLKLNGSNDYRIILPAKVPAKRFWSMLTYSTNTGAYVKGSNKVGIASNDPATVKNEEGSTTLNWSADCSGKINCMPVIKNENFFLLFRLYGPDTEFFDGSFVLNDLRML